jgi:exopolyphosphatase/guanosine-5'-triphosphate,3'-diphosphate pyrophosphatase
MAAIEAKEYRSLNAFERILTLPIQGIDHRARLFLALTLYARYAGNLDGKQVQPYLSFLSQGLVYNAKVIGQLLRLLQTVSSQQGGVLAHVGLTRRGQTLILTDDSVGEDIEGERVQKYLTALAKSLAMEPVRDIQYHR